MWTHLFSRFLDRLISRGALCVVDADGTSRRYGAADAAPITLRFHRRGLARKLLLNPDLYLGEAYVDGALTIDGDDLYGFLELVLANLAAQPETRYRRWRAAWRRAVRAATQYNPVARARRNVAHHYDLSDALYSLFLDADRQYSCAYFRTPEDDLPSAQRAKKDLIAAKLCLSPGQKVLDIGCGWGGLGLSLARNHGVRVTGITLSDSQLAVAQQRAVAAGLDGQVSFRLQDYRELTETFDRIVSVGMFEHVGVTHYGAYFNKLRDALSDDGVALVHTIGRADVPGAANPWIDKYIFPGGYTPALSDILPAIERSGLYVTDIEVWRLHYAETLKAWRARFEAHRDRVRAIYDARFCRMWSFYLVACELAFRYNRQVVFQIQLAKKQDAVPLTRDYLYTPRADDQICARARQA